MLFNSRFRVLFLSQDKRGLGDKVGGGAAESHEELAANVVVGVIPRHVWKHDLSDTTRIIIRLNKVMNMRTSNSYGR